MLRAAIIFFLMGVLAFFFGLYGVAGLTVDIGKLLLLFFVIFGALSFVGAVNNKNSKNL